MFRMETLLLLIMTFSVNMQHFCLLMPCFKTRSTTHLVVSVILSCGLLLLLLVHGQVTIIFVVSVCLSVCLFVCAEFFLNRLRSELDQTRTHVTCPGLVVSPRIQGLCHPWGLGDPKKLIFLGVWGQP